MIHMENIHLNQYPGEALENVLVELSFTKEHLTA